MIGFNSISYLLVTCFVVTHLRYKAYWPYGDTSPPFSWLNRSWMYIYHVYHMTGCTMHLKCRQLIYKSYTHPPAVRRQPVIKERKCLSNGHMSEGSLLVLYLWGRIVLHMWQSTLADQVWYPAQCDSLWYRRFHEQSSSLLALSAIQRDKRVA